MPGRLTPLVNDQIYHVFNRGINHQPTFLDKLEYKRARLVIDFYRFSNLPAKLSKFLTLSNDDRTKIMDNLRKEDDKLVEILAFCLMPNHFHFLIKQIKDKGISKFLGNFQNSYTRYSNTKRERDGSLFLDQFKAKLIITDEQLIHISRYIHLNPYTSYVVKDLNTLFAYPWSSLSEYLSNKAEICNLDIIMSLFINPKVYQKFIEDHADYQRQLHKIQHLVQE
ncbi:transposase [Candidatus Daviesbacteria bacterium]|nr:transposase [Candidatus Daviesbacteria bacterium]